MTRLYYHHLNCHFIKYNFHLIYMNTLQVYTMVCSFITINIFKQIIDKRKNSIILTFQQSPTTLSKTLFTLSTGFSQKELTAQLTGHLLNPRFNVLVFVWFLVLFILVFLPEINLLARIHICGYSFSLSYSTEFLCKQSRRFRIK